MKKLSVLAFMFIAVSQFVSASLVLNGIAFSRDAPVTAYYLLSQPNSLLANAILTNALTISLIPHSLQNVTHSLGNGTNYFLGVYATNLFAAGSICIAGDCKTSWSELDPHWTGNKSDVFNNLTNLWSNASDQQTAINGNSTAMYGNFTNMETPCADGNYVYAKSNVGTFLCRADQTGGGEINNGTFNETEKIYVYNSTFSRIDFNETKLNQTIVANASSEFDFIIGKRFGFYEPITTAVTAFTAVGMTLPTVVGTPTANTTADPTRMMIRYASAATNATLGGQTGTYTETKPRFSPIYSTVVRTDLVITDRTIWIGLTSAALTTTYPLLTQKASALTFVAVVFQHTTGGGYFNSGDWACCSGDGVNMQCTDMNLLVKTNTTYTVKVDWSQNQNLLCTAYETDAPANKGTATRTTLLSTGVTGLGVHNGQTTLTAAIRYYHIAKGMLKQN